jgi:hypothetical protein
MTMVMTDTHPETFRPAPPGSGGIDLGALFFSLCAGPAAWFLQLVVNYALASMACFPHDFPRTHPLPGLEWVGPGRIVISTVAAVVALAATVASLRIWRAIARHYPAANDDLLPLVAGRARFLAASGVMLGLVSFAAILFALVPLLTLPSCPG